MSIQKALAIEIERETENTLRFLKVLPENNFSYKPHEKSMTLGELANHVVELHGWVSYVFTKDTFDFHTDYTPSTLQTVDELVKALEDIKTKSLEVINSLSDEEYFKNWTLKAGDHIIAEAPKSGAYRFIVTNHLIHHRGQLSVYLRMLDIPLPGIYGPSADEK
ncbi:DinB family protein [Chryseobacterium sp. POL2]|uniref:DinB family protein n=1 Tax=Chryseobacterium sp. POL2 TaxID=2713414 RepID=UPI0013E10324|nr:DinB family protein [Chryseobacterium sp. POL2]QIG90290.1 DinB family protein [Chryseobacterium sp. POL2]